MSTVALPQTSPDVAAYALADHTEIPNRRANPHIRARFITCRSSVLDGSIVNDPPLTIYRIAATMHIYFVTVALQANVMPETPVFSLAKQLFNLITIFTQSLGIEFEQPN